MATHPITLDLGLVIGPEGPAPSAEAIRQAVADSTTSIVEKDSPALITSGGVYDAVDAAVTPAVNAAVNAAVTPAVNAALTPTVDSVSQKIQPSQNVSLNGYIYRIGSLCILNLFLSKQNESGAWGTETPGSADRIVATISDSNLFPVHTFRGALGHTSEIGTNTPSAYFVISEDGTISINNQANFVMFSAIYPVAVPAN